MAAGSASRSVLVWDLATRLFHWGTVLLVIACYVTWRLNWIGWHVRVGSALLALVVFRLAWGFVGSSSTRFARFVVAPWRAFAHLAHMLRLEPDREAGHNPAGGWMVLVLLALLLAQSLTGVYLYNDIASEGPLSEVVPPAISNLISDLHTVLWYVLLGAVALHLGAVATYQLVKHHHLIRAIVTGRKALPADVPAPQIASGALALAVFTVACVAAWAISYWL